jgi:hypothetical protein
MELNPQVVFERMFGDGSTIEQRAARRKRDQSILDSLTGSLSRLRNDFSSSDRARLDDYTENVREIERRLQIAMKASTVAPSDMTVPVGVPQTFDEHIKLQFDLMALAFQADITRVSTFMMAREVSYRTFPMLGISEGFHPASHHQNNKERLENLTKINTYHVSLVAHLLERLKATPDGDGNLLDHSLILYGSGMSNSNVHNHSPLPVLLAGGAAGRMKGGRHLKNPDETPMANLLLSILDKAGCPQESIGDSTGLLSEV